MNANKPPMDPEWVDPDDAPDLATPQWRAVLDAAPVTRGRPRSARPKVSTTLRLDAMSWTISGPADQAGSHGSTRRCARRWGGVEKGATPGGYYRLREADVPIAGKTGRFWAVSGLFDVGKARLRDPKRLGNRVFAGYKLTSPHVARQPAQLTMSKTEPTAGRAVGNPNYCIL